MEFAELNEVEFIYLSLIKALCRSDLSTVFLITSLEVDVEHLKTLEQFLKVKIYWIKTTKDDDLKKTLMA